MGAGTMRLAVISDLHLGVGDASDRFGHEEGPFGRFLDALERSFDTIVVNGDLFETWQGARFGRPQEAFRRACRHHRRLAPRLLESPYRLTFGNHDALLAEQGAVAELELEADGVRVLLTHGDRFDPPLKRARPIAYTFCWTTGWMRRHQAHPVVRRVDRVRHRFEARHLYNASPQAHVERIDEGTCRYQRGALGLLRARPELSVVAFGHTHVPAATRSPWGVYLNSGTMEGGRFAWAAIDTATAAFAVLSDCADVTLARDLLATRAGALRAFDPRIV